MTKGSPTDRRLTFLNEGSPSDRIFTTPWIYAMI